jgi:transcriptional regulator with XRE-family HTH domain
MPKGTLVSPRDPSLLTPGQLMGLAGLLRAWRAAAGQRKGLGRALTQEEIAKAVERSVRWYSGLESGATPRLERPLLDALADVLELGRDEVRALHLYALGGTVPTITAPRGDGPTRRALQLLLDNQMPSPAYLCDGNWNIIGHNSAMADWWPFVQASNANLIRWALLSKEARQQYIDWPHHAAEYLSLLRFAVIRSPDDTELATLLHTVLQDEDCLRMWNENIDLLEDRDSHHFRLALPKRPYDIVEVVSHVLYTAGLPNSRLVVITWVTDDPQQGCRTCGSPAPDSAPAGERLQTSTHAAGTPCRSCGSCDA